MSKIKKNNCPPTSKVEAKVDCRPPKITLETYYDQGKLERNAQRVLEIDKENMELLKRLYIISQSRGRVGRISDVSKESGTTDRSQKKSENERIRKENLELYKTLQQVTPTFSTFPPEAKDKKKKIKSSLRPRCFFEIEIPKTNEKLGTFEIELYTDIVPNICKIFQSLCSGEAGVSYKGTEFTRIIQGYLSQWECNLKTDEIDEASLIDEKQNSSKKHTRPGIISFQSVSKNSIIFNLTFKKLEILDGKNVVIGQVVRGLSNIYKIEAVGTKIGKPREKIIISNCGVC